MPPTSATSQGVVTPPRPLRRACAGQALGAAVEGEDAGAALGGPGRTAERLEQLAAGAHPLGVGERRALRGAGGQLPGRDEQLQGARHRVEADRVAVLDQRDRAPRAASGDRWMAAGTLPEAPDMRPSVTIATFWPRSSSTAIGGVSLCSSGMPLALGPW
nr:hypothetical protein GCM10020093_005070 [Planobispora longispora]